MIYPGTTPEIPFIFPPEVDLSEITQIWVTFKDKRAINKTFEKTYDISQVSIDLTTNTVTVNMSQEDTLNMAGTTMVEAQIRLLGPNTTARETTIVDIPVGRVLKGGVIS